MPAVRRKVKWFSRHWTDRQWTCLEIGPRFLSPDENPSELADGVLRRAWRDLRDYIVASFIAQHPGHRPWGFWRYEDLPERPVPRVIASRVVFPTQHHRRLHEAVKLAHGYGRWFDDSGWPGGVLEPEPINEPSVVYLHRHGLLAPGEVERYWADGNVYRREYPLLPCELRQPGEHNRPASHALNYEVQLCRASNAN